jgi:hypothetical protein
MSGNIVTTLNFIGIYIIVSPGKKTQDGQKKEASREQSGKKEEN